MSDDQNTPIPAGLVELTFSRLSETIAGAINALPFGEVARRIEWCRENNRHGVHMVAEGDDRVLWWGGQPLAVVPLRLLTDPNVELHYTPMPDVPDDISELTQP